MLVLVSVVICTAQGSMVSPAPPGLVPLLVPEMVSAVHLTLGYSMTFESLGAGSI
jgi:hypothetical protein